MNQDKLLGAVFALFIGILATFAILKPVSVETLRSETVFIDINGLGHGSGVIIDGDRVYTAGHVAKDLTKNGVMTVTFFNGETAVATVEWVDENSDSAFLKVKVPKGYEFAPLACNKATSDEAVTVIGNPLDIRWSVTHGAIVTDRPITMAVLKLPDDMPQAIKDKITKRYAERKKNIATVIPMSALAAPGSSGGPVFNARGAVVGNVTGILFEDFGDSGSAQASTFSVITPSKYACEHLNGTNHG